MPRENRKRGKKHKTQPEQVSKQPVNFKHEEKPEPIIESLDQPSWIISGPRGEEVNPEAPYGYVDADVKAYFRTVDIQIRDWHERRDEDAREVGDVDPNDRMFLLS
jgi:nucleolar protein 9